MSGAPRPGDRLIRLLLVIVVGLLLLGSSVFSDTGSVIFFLRFAAMSALAVATVLSAGAERAHSVPARRGYAVVLGAFTVLAFVSAAWSIYPTLSLQRAVGFAIMSCAVLALVATWSSRATLMADLSAVAGILGTAILASLVVYPLHLPWAFSGVRFRGVLENPNTIGVVAALVVPLAWGLAAHTHRFVRTWWVFVIACAFVAVIAAGSRGGLFAIGAGLLAYSFQSRAKRRLYWALPLGGLIPVAVVFATASLNGTVSRFLSLDSAGRTSAWSLMLFLWEQRPWLGWGFGTTDIIFPRLQGSLVLVFNGASAHNAYLQTLFEVGPLGLLLLLIGIGLALRGIRIPATDFFEAGVFGSVVAGGVNQIFESGLTSPGSIIAFNFWLLALASVRLASVPAVTRPYQPTSPVTVKYAATASDH